MRLILITSSSHPRTVSYRIAITIANHYRRTHVLCAASTVEMDEWLTSLKHNLALLRQLKTQGLPLPQLAPTAPTHAARPRPSGISAAASSDAPQPTHPAAP